jgi:hypothetical protein
LQKQILHKKEKKMKHKAVLNALVVVLVLSMVACGKSTVTTPTSQPPVVNTPVTQANDLVISSTNAFIDSYGTYRVVGEVVNQSSTIITSIELTLDIKDASGNSLLKDDNGNITLNTIISPMLYTLAPGEASPFEYSYDTTNGTPASYNVTITGKQTGTANRSTMKWENVQLVDDGSGWYYLTGELVNTSSQWAHINSLAGAVLDDSNNVLSADWTGTYTTELAPKGDVSGRDRTPFEINFPNPTNATQWSLYWDADVADNVTDYPLVVKVTDSYFDQNGSEHLVGWVTNNSDQSLDSLVIGGLYGADGTVLDASYSFLSIPMKPGEAIPFNISSFGSVDYSHEQASLVSSYTAQFDTYFTSPPSSEFVDLSAAGETIQKDGATWNFSGSVTNSSDKSLSSATVVVMVMDAQNNLIAMEYTTVYPTGDAIATGETNTYTMSVYLDPAIDASGFSTTTMVVGNVK